MSLLGNTLQDKLPVLYPFHHGGSAYMSPGGATVLIMYYLADIDVALKCFFLKIISHFNVDLFHLILLTEKDS